MRTTLVRLFILVAGISLTGVVLAQNGLEGVWQIEEATIVGGENEGTNSDPQPNLYIFTGQYYSTVIVPGDSPRQQLSDENTDEERLAAYDNFVANAGTYEVSGSTLTILASVAKNPAAMMGGEGFTYQYSLDGDSLTLVLAAAWAGEDAEITYRLNRLE